MILTPRCEPSGEPVGWLGKRNRATGEADLAVEAKEVAVGQPAAAESAAKKGDTEGSLKYLKAAGKWTLDTATKIVTQVAVKAIESAIKAP